MGATKDKKTGNCRKDSPGVVDHIILCHVAASLFISGSVVLELTVTRMPSDCGCHSSALN